LTRVPKERLKLGRGRFGDDDRIVTGVEVYRFGDGFRVLACSESPPPAVRMAFWLRRMNQLVGDWPS